MAKLEESPKIELEVVLRLSEVEARYLFNLSSYNHQTILAGIEAVTGKAYTAEYNRGFFTFMSACEGLGPMIAKTTEAREVFTGRKKAVLPQPKDQL